ncbi:sensor domain-containing diguanylate cyclase [Neobacillus niacini]|uniref:sensor domain-containing diguanylate cyclase n=1 Tax=Neobacillus niacini TaxID=86668 RepID=UPI0021CB4BF5|nr:sensor domain-containing diguanylate cyclase [Neobacillus niacini]MCM3763912.1 PAS domain S-box protein [Neobacillus niacini]
MVSKLSGASFEIYHSIIEHNPDAIFVVSIYGIIEEVNPVVTNIFGYAKGEIQGIPFHDIIVPDQVEKFDYHAKQIAQGNQFKTTIKAVHRSGEILDLQLKCIPLIVKNEIIGIFCVAKVLTELTKNTFSLKQLEGRFNALFNSIADAVHLLDLNGNIIDVNPAFEKLYGWKREELVGKPSPIIPENRLKYANLIKEKVKLGENLSGIEVDALRKDGTILTVSLTFSPVRNVDGEIVAFSGVARDISRYKQLEVALKESEEWFRLIADNATDLIAMFKPDGVVKYASPSHELVLGFLPVFYEGLHILDMIHSDDIPKVESLFTSLAQTKKEKIIEFRHKHWDGHWVWMESKVIQILNEKGDILHFLALGRDMTERKMYRERLTYMAYHDTLTGLPNRRLFKERLDQSLKEAKRYERKLAVIFMDIDNFKQVNDTYGHDAGDELLKQFSNRVMNQLRESDTIARLGGDEFTILLPEFHEELEVERVARRIITSLQEPWKIEGNTLRITSSMGIAFYPKDGTNRHELLKSADSALYEVKRSGKNNIKTNAPINKSLLV